LLRVKKFGLLLVDLILFEISFEGQIPARMEQFTIAVLFSGRNIALEG
jgi:hypothetical protein